MTLISAPLQRFMPVREIVLQPMSFGEMERPTTNPFPSLLSSLPEDFPYQTPKYESDVFSQNRRRLRIKTGTFPGSSRNRDSIGQAKGVGMKGEIKVSFTAGFNCRETRARKLKNKPNGGLP